MTQENLQAALDGLMEDAVFAEKLSLCSDAGEILSLLEASGLTVSAEELAGVLTPDCAEGELDESGLETVSGGLFLGNFMNRWLKRRRSRPGNGGFGGDIGSMGGR